MIKKRYLVMFVVLFGCMAYDSLPLDQAFLIAGFLCVCTWAAFKIADGMVNTVNEEREKTRKHYEEEAKMRWFRNVFWYGS